MIKRLLAPGADSAWTSMGLLILRLVLGLTMFLNHGLGKLKGFSSMSSSFPDPLGVGHAPSLVLAIFAEVVCSILIVIGLTTRAAAVGLVITMAVAFFLVHKAALSGEQSGELALIYLAGFLCLMISGAGAISLDRKFFKGASRS